MTLSPLAIALQGIGYGPLLVGVQGFASVDILTPPPSGGGMAARFIPFLPVPAKRRRKRRELDLIFLGH